MSDPADKSARKQRGRPFQPGQSGNPHGRPAGSRTRLSVALDELAEGAAPKLLDVLVKAGMAGDAQAARLILDRAWPARKGRAVTLDLPRIEQAGDVVAAMDAITQATADGTLTPDEGQALAGLVEANRKAIEIVDLERRIERLEAKDAKS